MKKIFGFAIIICAVLAIFACYVPSPLYGTWTSNTGDKISFANDNSFSATIIIDENNKVIYTGMYTVAENVLSFSIMTGGSGTVVTEWDIRGSILYLEWPLAVPGTNTQTKRLSLYHN